MSLRDSETFREPVIKYSLSGFDVNINERWGKSSQIVLNCKQTKGLGKEFFPQKFEITMEVGRWVQVSLGFFFGGNHRKVTLNQY